MKGDRRGMSPPAAVLACADHGELGRVLRRTTPGVLLAAAAGFFTVWSWVYTAVVGPRRALPLLAGVSCAGAYIAHARPREMCIPVSRRGAVPGGMAPLRVEDAGAVAAVRPPAIAALDAAAHQLPFLLAALWALWGAAAAAAAGRPPTALVRRSDAVAPVVLLFAYTLCVDPVMQYNLAVEDVFVLVAVYAGAATVLWRAAA